MSHLPTGAHAVICVYVYLYSETGMVSFLAKYCRHIALNIHIFILDIG